MNSVAPVQTADCRRHAGNATQQLTRWFSWKEAVPRAQGRLGNVRGSREFCVSAHGRRCSSPNVPRVHEVRPLDGTRTRRERGNDRTTRTSVEHGVSYAVGLGHRHCPCICHVIPLKCSAGFSPKTSFAFNYTVVRSVPRSSHRHICCADFLKNQTPNALTCVRGFLLRNLKRTCDRANQSRSHPPMSVSLNLLLWCAAEKSGAPTEDTRAKHAGNGFVRLRTVDETTQSETLRCCITSVIPNA